MEGFGVPEEIINEATDANPWEEHDRDGWMTMEFMELFCSRIQNTSYTATSIEMTPEYF